MLKDRLLIVTSHLTYRLLDPKLFINKKNSMGNNIMSDTLSMSLKSCKDLHVRTLSNVCGWAAIPSSKLTLPNNTFDTAPTVAIISTSGNSYSAVAFPSLSKTLPMILNFLGSSLVNTATKS